MKALSPMRTKILDFITSFIDENGYPPSVREIGEAVGLKSPSTVHLHIKVLQDEGLLGKSDRVSRALTVKNKPAYKAVPVLGTVTAGVPILAQQEICGYVPYENRDEAQVFALNVRGESMINAGILDGDVVIVKIQPSARHGDIVVALIGDEATVKRLSTKDGIWLMPENPDFSPIDGSSCKILGKVVGLYRSEIK